MPKFPRPTTPTSTPVPSPWSDPWLSKSALQKAIRRGETAIAERAALALHDQGQNVWRRLVVIAYEDIGIGSPEAVIETTSLASMAMRSKAPPSRDELLGVVRMLSEAPKDRSADYLISVATLRRELEPLRARLGAMSNPERAELIGDPTMLLEEQATAVRYLAGLEPQLAPGDRALLAERFRDLGVDDRLVSAAATAAMLTREPICWMIPIINLAAGTSRQAAPGSIPASPEVNGMPLYALDMHTRIGQRAISAFVRAPEVRLAMLEHVPEFRLRHAGFCASSYIDATPVTPKLTWSQSSRIEALGIDTDMRAAGVPSAGIEPVLQVFGDHQETLNRIRADLLGEWGQR